MLKAILTVDEFRTAPWPIQAFYAWGEGHYVLEVEGMAPESELKEIYSKA